MTDLISAGRMDFDPADSGGGGELGGRRAAPEFVTIDTRRVNLECDAAAKGA